jgi:hypothetical protein
MRHLPSEKLRAGQLASGKRCKIQIALAGLGREHLPVRAAPDQHSRIQNSCGGPRQMTPVAAASV